MSKVDARCIIPVYVDAAGTGMHATQVVAGHLPRLKGLLETRREHNSEVNAQIMRLLGTSRNRQYRSVVRVKGRFRRTVNVEMRQRRNSRRTASQNNSRCIKVTFPPVYAEAKFLVVVFQKV